LIDKMKILRSVVAFTILAIIPQFVLAMPQKGEPAPPFAVTSTTGQPISLANYKGKVLIMEYFATWCSPCRDSVAHLVNLNQKFGKLGVQILGMSLDEHDEKAVREFIVANKVNYPVAFAEERLQTDYAVRSVPTLYVIGKNGVIAEKFMGYNDRVEKNLDTLLKKLLAE